MPSFALSTVQTVAVLALIDRAYTGNDCWRLNVDWILWNIGILVCQPNSVWNWHTPRSDRIEVLAVAIMTSTTLSVMISKLLTRNTHKHCSAALVKRLSPHPRRISKWMAFALVLPPTKMVAGRFFQRQFTVEFNTRIYFRFVIFLLRCMQCRRGLAMRKLSVCLSVYASVCLSNPWIVTKRKKDLSRFLYYTKDHLA